MYVSHCTYSRVSHARARSDPDDESLRAAFEQYAKEKNGSGLNTAEQLARLKLEFPKMNIKYDFDI